MNPAQLDHYRAESSTVSSTGQPTQFAAVSLYLPLEVASVAPKLEYCFDAISSDSFSRFVNEVLLQKTGKWYGMVHGGTDHDLLLSCKAPEGALIQIQDFFNADDMHVLDQIVLNLRKVLHSIPNKFFCPSNKDAVLLENLNAQFCSSIFSNFVETNMVLVFDIALCLLSVYFRCEMTARKMSLPLGFHLFDAFPCFHILKMLPYASLIVKGLLGFDFVSFESRIHRDNFLDCVASIFGDDIDICGNSVKFNGRRVDLNVFPHGIDLSYWRALSDASLPQPLCNVRQWKTILSVSKLDIVGDALTLLVNGIRQFLIQFPVWREKVQFLVIIVPSGSHSRENTALRSDFESKFLLCAR